MKNTLPPKRHWKDTALDCFGVELRIARLEAKREIAERDARINDLAADRDVYAEIAAAATARLHAVIAQLERANVRIADQNAQIAGLLGLTETRSWRLSA